MPVDRDAYQKLLQELRGKNIALVAVSKTKPVEEIKELYDLGHRDFGENYVQELTEKQAQLPKDIRWHFIGHLQSNKVKQIVPFIHLVHGVDSLKLLKEINKQAIKINRRVDCLLQIHIAEEETKFGWDEAELKQLLNQNLSESSSTEDGLAGLKNIRIAGLMGMASFSNDMQKVRQEFRKLKSIFDQYSQLKTENFQLRILSMGMTADYQVAIEEGSNLLRIGSLVFGIRS